ncbi:MAG: glycosyltransferase family 2 protein [Thiotrichales bacterium]|nr:MAG: glycosyltransferase family 2 protein [Thiotrichales bacterium]
MEALFYVSAFLCVYSYFLYPLILMLLPVRKKSKNGAEEEGQFPLMSLIISAYNEEEKIAGKLENTLEIEYPRDLLEIIVASDGSSDATDSIVESFADRGVSLVRVEGHKGKDYAQQRGIQASNGAILVFSDVATQIPKDAFSALKSAFEDASVGAVSSEDRFISHDGRLVGEGAYVRYEMWLRRLESDRAGVVGLSGSFFAARREVCEPWDALTDSDFNVARNCARMGLVAISDPAVVGCYRDLKNPKQEYYRKVRTVIRGITAIPRHSWVLNPFRAGLFAFQVWSHKIMRWGVPWFMLVFAVATLMLQGQAMVYALALLAQVIFYSVALAGWLSERMQQNTIVRIVFYFVQTNLALAHAAVAFLSGKRMTAWNPTRR